MDVGIDRSKCGPEYSLCEQCKFDDISYRRDKCQSCTRVVDIGYSMILCGVPVGSGITHLHKNFERKGRVSE